MPLLKEMRFWGDLYEMKKDALEAVDSCVEINQCVGCPFHGDGAAGPVER